MFEKNINYPSLKSTMNNAECYICLSFKYSRKTFAIRTRLEAMHKAKINKNE